MKLGISAESTIDLSPELLKEYDVRTIPFPILFGEELKYDGQFTNQDIFNYVEQTGKIAKTSAINQFQYEQLFEEMLKEYDEIIHIGFSSELSSSFRNVVLAAERFNGKVHVIDSLSLSTGMGLLAMYARDLANENKDINEIVNLVKARVAKISLSFIVEKINYLHKGGRCSAMAALGANLFHIRPEIVMREGKLYNDKKFRGLYSKTCEQYVDDILATFPNPDLSHAFITHCVDDPTIVEMAKQKLLAHGFKKIYITFTGCTITTHCGPNTLGLVFFYNL